MATVSISQLDTATQASVDDLYEVAVVDANSQTGYASRKLTAAQIATLIAQGIQFSGLSTEAKTIIAAINEASQNGGSEVEPNPVGEPTDTLEKIGIDGTVYEVGASEPVSKTVTGNPISITDAADAPIVSGEVTFEPQQDLHGYDKPWAGGAGKNKCPYDSISFISNATWVSLTGTAASSLSDGTSISLKAGTYYISISDNSNIDNLQVSLNDDLLVNSYRGSFTLESDSTIKARLKQASAGTQTEGKIQIEIGTIGTSWTPYSNICPPTGLTEASVEVTGKNKLQNTASTNTVDGVTYTVYSDGRVVASGTANGTAVLQICSKIPIDVSWGTVTLSGLVNTTNLVWNSVILYDDSDTVVERIVTTGSGQNKYDKTFNLTDYPTAAKISVSVKRLSNGAVGGTIYPQLEKGSTATPYKPYQSTSYTIDLDGTRYGGTVYPVTGKMSDSMGHIASYAGESIGEPWLSDRDEYVAGTTPSTGAEVVYTLASPVTVQLTPAQIRTLEGTNNISTNMDGMSLEYITQDYQSLVKLIERSAGHHYSEQERVVGTWINGKPLYEKTVDIENLPNNTTVNVAHGISDISLIVSISGFATGVSNTIPLPYSSVGGTYNINVNADTTNINIQTGYNASGYSGYVTLIYTKTTD